MIFDELTNAEAYAALDPAFSKAFAFLRDAMTSFPADGKHLIDGEDLFASVQSYDTAPIKDGAWEAHRCYLDIQCVLAGEEQLGWAPLRGLLQANPYKESGDCQTAPDAEGGCFVPLRPGQFAILYPWDAHMPGRSLNGSVPVKKIVVKIRIH